MNHLKNWIEKSMRLDWDTVKPVLEKYKENTWVYPTNATDTGYDYDLFETLHEIGLVAKKRIHFYKNGIYSATTTKFYFNYSLDYWSLWREPNIENPNENQCVLICEQNSKQSVARYSSSLPWWRNKVKGWMPLPEPI